MAQNLNQYKQSNIRGKVDLDITTSRIIQCQISANQATALAAGDAVKLDTSSGNVPQVLDAAASDRAFGHIIADVKKAAPVAGDFVLVALADAGPILWVVSTGTISAGADVESVGGSGTNVQAISAGKKRGTAIDPGITTGDLIRIIVNSVKSA